MYVIGRGTKVVRTAWSVVPPVLSNTEISIVAIEGMGGKDSNVTTEGKTVATPFTDVC